jgi:hypothetical protein
VSVSGGFWRGCRRAPMVFGLVVLLVLGGLSAQAPAVPAPPPPPAARVPMPQPVPPIESPAAVATAPSSRSRTAVRSAETPRVVRELVEHRRASRSVYEREDGSQEIRMSGEPRFYERAPGEWVDIDTRVVTDSVEAGVLRSAANGWVARFRQVGDERGAVSVETRRGRSGSVRALRSGLASRTGASRARQ